MSTVSFANEVKISQFKHLKVEVDPETRSVWLYFNTKPRPSITTTLLKELLEFQNIIKQQGSVLTWKGNSIQLDYHVICSKQPVFSFGGDLEYFLSCIERNDSKSLKKYAYDCIRALYPNYTGFDNQLITISLIQGNALGGGLEAALSSNVVIAEKRVDMGLPEVLFNLFPGMGAFNLISQRTNSAFAEKMMLDGRLYSSEELYEKGLVDILSDVGQGVESVYEFIETNSKRKESFKAINRVKRCSNKIDIETLFEVCDIWVETAFSISEKDLRTMSRLVRSQNKFARTSHDSIYEEGEYENKLIKSAQGVNHE